MDKSAIEHIQNTAITAVDVSKALHPVISLPDSMKLHSLEKYQAFRYRFRGEFSTQSINDFAEYVKGNDDAQCFIDAKHMRANAIFDLGTVIQPGHAEHKATLNLEKTAPYTTVLNVDGTQLSQQDLAEFIEEWKHYITVIDANGADMEVKKAIAAIRRVTIESRQKLDHGQENFGANKSTMESIEAKSGDNVLPAWILFTCFPYEELTDYTFHLRLSLLTGRDKPVFIPRIIQLEVLKEQMAQEFKRVLSNSFGDKAIKTYLGEFKA